MRAVGLSEVRSWWAGADGLARAVAGATAAGVVLSFALVMQQLLTPLTRLYEGYWGGTRTGRALIAVGRARQERRWDRLDQIIQERRDRDRAIRAYRLRHQRFPRERSDVMPTRMGNVFQAAESYPSDARLYGMDAVFFWPRLYSLLPDSLRAELAAARSAIDMMLVTSVLSVTLGLGICRCRGGGAVARARPGLDRSRAAGGQPGELSRCRQRGRDLRRAGARQL